MGSRFECLEFSVEGAIAHIRFKRPDLLNRFDEALHEEFPRALQPLAGARDIAALVLSAEGKAFSAGGDLEMMLRANASADMRERLRDEALAIVEGLLALPFPAIAAVQGAAIGLGATIVTCCDIVVAWRQAKIADPHVILGLVAGDGGILGWTQSVGALRAKRYLLTGDRITAEQAFAMGLVSDLVDTPDEAMTVAFEIAARIAALPRGGVRGTKRAFSRLTRQIYGATFELSLAYEMEALGGAEVLDAVKAARDP